MFSTTHTGLDGHSHHRHNQRCRRRLPSCCLRHLKPSSQIDARPRDAMRRRSDKPHINHADTGKLLKSDGRAHQCRTFFIHRDASRALASYCELGFRLSSPSQQSSPSLLTQPLSSTLQQLPVTPQQLSPTPQQISHDISLKQRCAVTSAGAGPSGLLSNLCVASVMAAMPVVRTVRV